MTYKLDIFDLLKRIDSPKHENVYAGLSDEEKKGFAPLIVMRWMSGTSNDIQISLLNEFVNPYVFPLGKHPELLMQLLQASSGSRASARAGYGRYQWIGVRGNKKNTEAVRAVSEFFGMSIREVRLLNPFPTTEEVLSMADSVGWQKDDIAKLKKEMQ